MGALGLALLRLVEPGVLERDGRVTRQHLEQPHVVVVELADPELGDTITPRTRLPRLSGTAITDSSIEVGALDLDGELALAPRRAGAATRRARRPSP